MKFRRNLLSRLYRNSDPDADSGGGGFVETPAVATPDPAASPAAEQPAAPGSMLEAMFGQDKAQPTEAEAAEAAATGKTVAQLRDEKGRFAGKDPAQAQADPLKPKEPAKVDPAAMPEGLTPKAQERFQALANTNKELTTRVAEWEPIVESARNLQQVFQDNGVKREQFDQAMEVVGLMNRGDLRGALKVLDEQRALISMHLGEPIAGADALARFPDLRQAVDGMQITEAHALEMARGRTQEAQRRQQQEQEQHAQQAQQQGQQAVQQGQLAVDKFCRARMADDMDYARIEPMLLKEIQEGLLQGIPPASWPGIVEKTYRLIKQTAASTRAATPAASVLRPTGGESPRQAPKSMHEAMWGSSQA